MVSIPPGLWLKQSDGTFARLDGLYAGGTAGDVAEAVSGFLGVDIAGVVTLNADACYALLDAAQPLAVSALSSVLYADGLSDSASEIEILMGEHQFDPDTAIAYVRGASDRERIRREQDVAQAVLAAPEGVISGTMAELTLDGSVDLSQEQIVSLVEELAERYDDIRWDVLPTVEDEVDGVYVEQPRIVEIEQLMQAIARGERALTSADVQVAVFNGNGERLMASRTAAYLEQRGFAITEAMNADRFTYATTYVVVLSDEAKAWLVQDTLSSPTEIVFPSDLDTYEDLEPSVPQGTDIVVIVGAGMELTE